MLSYQGQIKKSDFVAEMKKHQEADRFLRGTYWNGEKGCAVGCGIKSIAALRSDLEVTNFANHKMLEEHLGIPEWLARVEDTLFEGMSEERSRAWPVDFAESIPEGVDLNPIKAKFCVVLLKHSLTSLDAVQYDEAAWPQVKAAIEETRAAVQQMIAAHESGDGSAAWSAAESAAWSAESAAESAAWAAWSAARSAWSAESAARSAESAARSAWSAYDYYADELLKLIRGAK